ncbi:hypothetical protein L0F63_006921, partial [Massospora cicadina]
MDADGDINTIPRKAYVLDPKENQSRPFSVRPENSPPICLRCNKVVQPVSTEHRKEEKKSRKTAEKAKQKKEEEKEAESREEAAKRNIEQQKHLSSMTAPKTAQQPQDYAQWTFQSEMDDAQFLPVHNGAQPIK